jgi:membrane protease YdiL (CAAX protease family)
MKLIAATLAWCIGLCLLGSVALLAFGMVEFHLAPRSPAGIKLATLGLECGANLFILAFCFAALPGARRPPGARQKLGLVQGIWGMAGFGIVMAGGGLLIVNLFTFEDFLLIARHSAARIDLAGHTLLVGSAIAGEVAAGLWVLWYFRRLGIWHVTDGAASGIAWRPASARAYLAALAAAAAIILIVMVMFHIAPPDTTKIQSLPMTKLFTGSPVSLVPLLIIAVFIGPALEEMVFRGIAFAGIAARLGPLWAGVITTVLFMAAHAPEKIHYLPGFLDVGLVAATAVLLRLKFRSIRPGILLHIVYNAGSMVAASLIQ